MDSDLLTNSETLALVARYQATRDEEAFNSLLAHNERLLIKVASKYIITGASGDAQMDDLLQWGRIGFLRALEDYDPATGNKFMSYAYWWIRQFIGRHGLKQGQAITMSYGASQKRYHLSKANSAFFSEFHRDPTADELAQITGIRYASELRAGTVSLDGSDSSRDTDEFDNSLVDTSVNVQDEAEHAADRLFNLRILPYVDQLPAHVRDVLYAIYGLGGKEPMTINDVAAVFGVSQQRIRQIQKKGIEILRECENLGDYLA